MRILGIDPGSRITGYGLLEINDQQCRYVTCGCIRTQHQQLDQRLLVIFRDMQELIHTYQPDEMAIEKVFFHQNADAALKLGQARGAAICAVAQTAIAIYEYTPTQIKQAVVGNGHAKKQQVQHMVQAILALSKIPQVDAADALGVALCHFHTRQTLQALQDQQKNVDNTEKQAKQVLLQQALKVRRKKRFR